MRPDPQHSESLALRPPPHPLRRVLVLWGASAATIVVLAALLDGVHVNSVGAAAAAAALIGLLNALVWPVLLRLALPLTVLTIGFGVLLVNGAIVLLVSQTDIGFHVATLSAAIVVTICLSVVSTAVAGLLGVDDDGAWYRNVVTRHARRTTPPTDADKPGLLLLEIDGLAHGVLVRALRDGNAPTLARWLRTGTHLLTPWETDWSSQTGACQAGLLHGDNDDMPAFRWWEKERRAPIVTNHPRDAEELERRHSNGRGLLFADGASRANIFSGDAPHSLLTMSTVLRADRHSRIGQDYYAYFANPYNVSRTLVLVMREVIRELLSASRQRRLDVQPRIRRTFPYALIRAWATVIQRDLQVATVVGDMYAGRPVIYTTFLAYDEVAHHSGIERADTLATLRALDGQIGRIAAASRFAARPYRLVVLSDHGQSQGATFLDRYGLTLDALVRELARVDTASAQGSPSEAAGYLDASISEATAGGSAPSRLLLRLVRNRGFRDGEAAGAPQVPPIVVMASGCLGLVSWPREEGRLTLERLSELHPGLISGLRAHPGIGFVLVRSEEHGDVVLGRDGANYLDEHRVEGVDPLGPYGTNAGRHVRRTTGFRHCPDILVNSTYWPQCDEVAAFEELVGSHGGLGGEQSRPFLLYPAEFAVPQREMLGAEAVHRLLRRWLAELGHDTYDTAPADAADHENGREVRRERREREPAAHPAGGN